MPSRRAGAKPKFRRFHVRVAEGCPWCKVVKGCMYMHLHSTSEKQIMYYDRDTTEGESAWREQIAAAVPASHNTIPCVVAEFSDGSLMYIGGVEQFVRKLGCPMKD